MARYGGPGLVLCLTLWTSGFISATSQQQAKKVYRVTVKEEMPYIFQTPGASEGPNGFEGLLIDILNRVSRILDVKFSLNHVGDDAFGEKRDDGTWTGMIGELQRNESDIAAGPLTVTADRARIVDFSQPFSNTGLRILVKRPDNTPTSSDQVVLFVRPFSVGVWILILVTSAVLHILGCVNKRFNPREKHLANERNYDYEYSPAFNEKMMHSSKAGWFLSTTSKVFVVSSVTVYTAQLTSILVQSSTAEKQYLPFVTFEGLLNHPDINYTCLDKSFACTYFENSVQPLEKSIEFHLKWGKNTRYNNIDTATHHLRESTEQQHALIIESEFAYYVASKKPCDLIVVGEELGYLSHSFACRPGLSVCRDLDVAILTMKSTGELGRLRDKWLSGVCGKYSEMSSPYSHANRYTTDRTFNMNNERTVRSLGIPLVIVYSGVVVAICTMLWEIYRPKSKAVKMFRIEYHDRSDGIEIESGSGSDVIK
ncbi:glutamate receptor U1-like [Pecten maximus]|uniref:glutamate receptor U1-like n=1 Tax=Pecten maximus TaxID=6579 RepID=UPI0014581C86|nr:glutamate receptor U1-like [Pecten maximus]